MLLYERDGEWKSNVYFPFRIRLLTSVWVLRQIAKFKFLMEQYWRNKRGWQSGFIKFNTPQTVRPDERVCISIYIDFSISRNCRPFSLLVVMEMLSLIISAIVIVSLFLFRENTWNLCCFAHSRCHIGYNLNTGSNFNFSSFAVKCYVRVSVYKRYTVS